MTFELKIASDRDRREMSAILAENGYSVRSEERDVPGHYLRTYRMLIVEIPEEATP